MDPLFFHCFSDCVATSKWPLNLWDKETASSGLLVLILKVWFDLRLEISSLGDGDTQPVTPRQQALSLWRTPNLLPLSSVVTFVIFPLIHTCVCCLQWGPIFPLPDVRVHSLSCLFCIKPSSSHCRAMLSCLEGSFPFLLVLWQVQQGGMMPFDEFNLQLLAHWGTITSFFFCRYNWNSSFRELADFFLPPLLFMNCESFVRSFCSDLSRRSL